VDGRTVAQPKPRQSDVHVNAVADLLFVDIQLCVPASRLVNVDVRENIPNLVCFVGLSAGGKS
jgi:hypothetical protein